MTLADQAAMVNPMTGNYDVIIIGSGAGGGTLAHAPAGSGHVVDTSFFPSIRAVNPALTAMADALRVGDHIRQRMA